MRALPPAAGAIPASGETRGRGSRPAPAAERAARRRGDSSAAFGRRRHSLQDRQRMRSSCRASRAWGALCHTRAQCAGRPGEAETIARPAPPRPAGGAAGAEVAEQLLPPPAPGKRSFLQGFKSTQRKCNCIYIVSIILLLLITGGLAIALVKHTSPQECNNCPKGWMGYNGRCYYFSNGTRNWNESLEFCSSLGASLVIIKTKSDLEIINRYKEHFYYWIGLTKGAEGWRWVDGSPFTNDIITLENEAPNLNCGYLNTEKIVTIVCESLRRWICIRDVNHTFGPSRAAS